MILSEIFKLLVLCLCVVFPKVTKAYRESHQWTMVFRAGTNTIWKLGLSSEEVTEITETCCSHGEGLAQRASSLKECAGAGPPEDIEPDQVVTCLAALRGCCEHHFKQKDECKAGINLAPSKRCGVPKTDVGKTCCEECSLGKWTGESQGLEACGAPTDEDVSPVTALRKGAYYQCCVEAANKPTTTERPTTTTKKVTTTPVPKEKCKANSCDHICNADTGKVVCLCRDGYRLQGDKKTCKDINECAEATDDLCTTDGTVCHNMPGSFKCVPVRKRDVGKNCPAGFKKNLQNQVCDDINECQLPRPPCPKYLCANTIGGYTCAGKPGIPATESGVSGTAVTELGSPTTAKNDICPPGFRSGADDECNDIDECTEHLDDCQRLSQHCINTHGSFFCQDHVSKRCAPGFKVNAATGICEDIDECEESSMVCKRSEICINMPGAYTCKSKIDTLPKLATKNCQEGTRMRPGGSICEDIDECREGTHLCDQFQNCINTFGAHECRCKNGFELDSSGSCVDINECTLKLDNCREGSHCLNVLGSFTCIRRPQSTTTTPGYDYAYYDSEEDSSTDDNETSYSPAPSRPNYKPINSTPSTTTTKKPSPPPRPSYTTRRTTTVSPPRPTTRRTTTTESPPNSPRPDPRSTPTITSRPPLPPRPDQPDPRRTTTRTPYYNRPRPTRPTTNRRPDKPVHPTQENPLETRPGMPTRPTEVTVPAPTDPITIEKHKNREGSYGVNTSDIPKDRWTNVIGRDGERPGRPDTRSRPNNGSGFDLESLHCLFGYVRSENGECVDINECQDNRHICSNLEVCLNRPGGYVCHCMAGFRRDSSGWCVVDSSFAPTTTSTTEKTTTAAVPTRPASPEREHVPSPRRDRPFYAPPTACELGFIFDDALRKCVDIDECSVPSRCGPREQCVNFEGGYRCECHDCRPGPARPTYEVSPSPPATRDRNVITVGSQFGSRGPRYHRPTYTRLTNSGAMLGTCPWGYRLTNDRICQDTDECAENASECGPQQRCENFFGGYSCSCPAGHRLVEGQRCEDINECNYGQPCPYNSKCVNTVGAYRCECGEGFRNAPNNEKACVDIDECVEAPSSCEQGCANTWGGHRCFCQKGYRLHSDNRTCVDVDECSEWAAVPARGRLCIGDCVNEPGSYRCTCPNGYRLGHDNRGCIDINECETGEARCAGSSSGEEVCQNTRGGYHCHRIACPRGYQIESRHRCVRIQRSCRVSDWSCLQQPSAYTYNFITLISHVYLPEGSVDLFTMHGPSWSDASINFELRMVDVQASSGVQPADLGCFDMRPSNNVCVISLLCSLAGPQTAEMELTMSVRRHGQLAGSAVARLVVIVSQYDY